MCLSVVRGDVRRSQGEETDDKPRGKERADPRAEPTEKMRRGTEDA